MKRKRGDWIRMYGGYGGRYGSNVLAPGGYYELRCFRCDERGQILLPSEIELALSAMKGFEKRHRRCRQTLLGARFDLIRALGGQAYRLGYRRSE